MRVHHMAAHAETAHAEAEIVAARGCKSHRADGRDGREAADRRVPSPSFRNGFAGAQARQVLYFVVQCQSP